MQIPTEALYGVAAFIISGLLGVAWKLLRDEQYRTIKSVELRATQQELRDAEARHAKALADLQDRYQHDLETAREHFHSRLLDLAQRQDREFERVKGEMDDMKNTVREFQRETQQSFVSMRKDQQEGVDRVLSRMQELLLQIKS